MFIYTAICKNFDPSRIYIDRSLYLGVHLFLSAIFRKRCFPCDISMELPSGCKSCMLSHISHLTETHQNCFHICIYSGRFKIFANCCIYMCRTDRDRLLRCIYHEYVLQLLQLNYNIIRLFDLWGLKTEPTMSFHVLAQVTISTQGSVGRNPSFRSQKFLNGGLAVLLKVYRKLGSHTATAKQAASTLNSKRFAKNFAIVQPRSLPPDSSLITDRNE